MKGQLEELGEETDENVENISKMQGQILNMTKGKVNIFDGAGNFKSTYEIMKGIAEVWDDLSSIDQADLLETIAGKHRANDVAALLSNWKNVEAAVKSASEAEGSAARENAKYVDSLQGRLDKLTTSWQSFANTFMNSDFLKVAVSGLTKFVEILEGLIENIGSLGTIGIGAGVYGMFKNKGLFSGILGELSAFGSLASDVWKSGGKLTSRFKDIGSAAGMAGSSIASKFTGSLSGMIGGIGLAIAAIGLIVNAYKNYREEMSRARQEAIAASDEFLNASKSFEKAYIKYSDKTELTADEEADLASAINGTVDALGDKSSALQSAVDSSNDYLESLEAIKRAELEAAKAAADEKMEKAAEGLIEAAIGWETFDGSEVDIRLTNKDATDIAKEMKSEFVGETAKAQYGHLEGESFTMITLSADADLDEIIKYYGFLVDYQKRLEDSGLKDTGDYNSVTKAVERMSDAIEVYTDGVYEAVKAEYQLGNSIPKTIEDYIEMREYILGHEKLSSYSANQKMMVLNSLESEYSQLFDLSSVEAQARKFVGIIKGYGDGTKDGIDEIGTMETFINLKTKVNDNECSIGEYIAQIGEIEKMTKDWSDEEKELFNSTFGIDADSIKAQYLEVYDYVSSKRLLGLDTTGLTRFEIEQYKESEGERIKSFLKSLSKYELEAVANIKTELDWNSDNFDDILRQIEEEAKLIEAISFSIDLEVETEKLENLSGAISEAVSGSGLSTQSISIVEDMFGDLGGYDQSKLFERTTNGIRLNSEELRKLNDEYKETNVGGLEDKLDALADRYNQARDELSDLTYGTKEYNSKLSELQNIEDQINATEKLASQYRGLASAYQTWQRTESAGSQRDMYENMIEGFENVDDEISRGWLDDGTIEFLRLIKGENISATATTKELMAAYKSLDDKIDGTSYKIRDFFTVDEDGNSTNDGVYNFLEAIDEKFGGNEIVKKDDSGNIIGFNFDIAGGDEAIAEALGISEELVQIMVRAADDAGFVVSMDGTYQQLDILKEKAKEAAQELKGTFKVTNHDFFTDGSEEGILNDYQEAMKIWETFKQNKNDDGTIDMSVDGAEEAFTLVSTLQSMVDKLAEPVYMELDSSQVEKDMQKPLEKLQEYETLIQTEHQLQLKGTDTSQIEADKEEILNYFEELDPEIKAELGIEGLTREEIEAKIEAGEIKIPATIDLQVEMNETMRDMVNVALYNAGLIDKETLEKRVDIELYAEEIDDSNVDEEVEKTVEDQEGKKTTIEKVVEITGLPIMSTSANNIAEIIKGYTEEEQQVVLEFIADPSGYENYTPEDKEAIIKFIADSTDVEGYTPEEKEAYAKYIVDGGDLDAYTPEEKTAIAKYLADTEQVESYTPEEKEAIAKFLADTEQVDNYTPEQKQAIAKFIKDSLEVDNYKMPTNKQAYARYLKDSYDIDIWEPPLKEGDASYTPSLASTTLPAITGLTAWYTPKIRGTAGANGTANVNGTAFANGTAGKSFEHGDWGTKKTETALTGELGQELVVFGNRYWTVGDNGAEFATIPRGSIVFNHKQTEELLKNGKVTSGGGRGKALLSGTAYSKGSDGIRRVNKDEDEDEDKEKLLKKKKKSTTTTTTTTTTTPTSSPGSSGDIDDTTLRVDKDEKEGSSSSSSQDKFEETLDWIETKISRIERAIDKLDLKANSIFKNWSTRNKALVDEISKVQEEIEIQESAAQRYLQEANSVGLSESWASKVRNGEIDIDTIADEALADKIKSYDEWYQKYLDCIDAAEELKEKEAELYMQRFENVSAQYDGILGTIEHEKNMLEEYMNQAEAQGWLLSYEYYRALSSNEKRNISELEKQKADMLAELQNAMESGTIEKGSEAW